MGKSTLSAALGRALYGRCVVLPKDDARDFLVQYDSRIQQQCACASRCHADVDSNEVCYDIILHIAEKQLMYGLDVVFDSPLGRSCLLERCLNISNRLGASVLLVVIECHIEDSEWQKRLDERAQLEPKGHRPHNADHIRKYYLASQFCIPEHVPTIRCDMTQPPDVLAAQIIGALHCLDAS